MGEESGSRVTAMQGEICREEHLQWLGRLAARLSLAVRAGSHTAFVEAVKTSLSAECVQCGIRVGGEELLALGGATEHAGHSARAERLRLGYCARKGCDSYYYRVTARLCPGVDWLKLFDDSIPAESVARVEAELEDDVEGAGRETGALSDSRRIAMRIGLAILLIGGLLVARHWYRGGTIPLIREPENFVVDVIPGW